MQQDDQGRPLSDDGQWVWNGTEWEPSGGGQPPAGGDAGETQVAHRAEVGGSGQLGGQQDEGQQDDGQQDDGDREPGQLGPQGDQPGHGQPTRQEGFGEPAQQGSGQQAFGQPGFGPPAYAPPGGPGQPFGPVGPYGGGHPGGPGAGGSRNRTRMIISAVIGGLVVLAVAIVGLILLVSNSGKPENSAASGAPSPAVPSASPSGSPTPSPSASSSAASTSGKGPATGKYVCSTTGGSEIGNFTLTEFAYRAGGGGTGIWTWNKDNDEITFVGSDLSDFNGSYNRNTGEIELVDKNRTVNLTCARQQQLPTPGPSPRS